VEALIHFGVYVLEVLFFVGGAGSAIVILLTSIEDAEVLFEKDPKPAETETENAH
jgi:hypothetical protein